VGFSSVFLGFVVLNSEVVLRQGSVLLENEDGEVGVLCVFVLVKTTIAGTGIKGRKRFGFLSFACSDPSHFRVSLFPTWYRHLVETEEARQFQGPSFAWGYQNILTCSCRQYFLVLKT